MNIHWLNESGRVIGECGRLASVMAACLFTVATVLAPSADAAFPGNNGRIVFARVGRSSDIYSVRPDGTGMRRLTTHRAWDTSPSWSPDGKLIAYECRGAGRADRRGDICIMNRDGSNVQQITSGAAVDGSPAWSPDGAHLAFERYIEGDPLNDDSDLNFEIYTIAKDGTDLTRLTHSPGRDEDPSWSPDGSRIAFATHRSGNWDVWSVDPDGQMPLALTTDPSTEWHPNWSPDGSRIAFTRFENDDTRGGSYNLYTMAPDGTQQTLVGTTRRANATNPAWSPDGSEIVVVDVYRNTLALFAIKADGSSRRLLLYNGYWLVTPDWQPR
ncbi:MAG: hypothetical protein M3N53_13615 [Actinomycetota bacterium]|nr:hypothetical protein [Actinomycetota bacterium]